MKASRILLIFLFLLTACSKKGSYSVLFNKLIFVQMPTNLTVFENISPVIYKALCEHFQRVGCWTSFEDEANFKLRTKVIKLENIERFVSFDILPYVFKVHIKLECMLSDRNNKLISTKEFNFFRWISRPKSPVINRICLFEQYKDLLEKSIPRIEHYFRKYI